MKTEFTGIEVMLMNKRLNYRKLLENWMEFYSMTTELSKKMFATIWMRLQNDRKTNEKEKEK